MSHAQAPRPFIDLNADLGEGMGVDAGLMAVISSCNIACGGHAGDDETMAEALALARNHSVAAGAHPSYPDREGFGRREIEIGPDALFSALVTQIETLRTFAEREGITLTHVKPHGALYNVGARDEAQAQVVAAAAKAALPGAVLVGPPTGCFLAAAEEAGIVYRKEGFADRAYRADGSLVPRSEDGALIEDAGAQADQAVALARGLPLSLPDGGTLTLPCETLCVHGDTPGALKVAQAIAERLVAEGFAIGAPQ